MTLYPNITNASTNGSLLNLFTYANTVTGSLFGIVLLIAFFVVVYFNILKGTSSAKKSLATASVVTTILAILLGMVGMVADIVYFVLIFITAGSIVWLVLGKDFEG